MTFAQAVVQRLKVALDKITSARAVLVNASKVRRQFRVQTTKATDRTTVSRIR